MLLDYFVIKNVLSPALLRKAKRQYQLTLADTGFWICRTEIIQSIMSVINLFIAVSLSVTDKTVGLVRGVAG